MDELDLAILQQLFLNSRITNRELGEITNLSVSAVHKRIKALEDDKVISSYIARPSIKAMNSIPVVVIGTSRSKTMEKMLSEVGAHENVFAIAVASGKVLYISAMLRNIGELQSFGSTITALAQLNEPLIGIVNEPYETTPGALSEYELRIIKALSTNARKSYAELAEELGSSAKTIRKYLDEMISQGKVDFSMEWSPLYRENFVSVLHLYTDGQTPLNNLVEELLGKYTSKMIIIASFGNIPNFILFEILTQTPQETQTIVEELDTMGFTDVIPHVLYSISWYSNWMDDYIQSV